MVFTHLRHFHAHNVATFRKSPLAEISGSLGDLGTLLPLMIALAVNNSISLSTTLVFSGLWNILTGMAFGIPLPVQPMKVRRLLFYLEPGLGKAFEMSHVHSSESSIYKYLGY